MARQLHIVCVSGTREKLQMAAMIASVAAAGGDTVSVFFSMNALAYFVRNTIDAPVEGEFGTLLAQKGVPPFKQLFQHAVDLGDAQLLPCSMAVDLLRIAEEDLDPEFSPPMGLTQFLSHSEGGQLLTF